MQIYRIYGNWDLWNVQPEEDEDLSFLPLSASSQNRIELRFNDDGEQVHVVLNGNFAFADNPQTLGDVYGAVNDLTVYANGALDEYRAFAPGFDIEYIKHYDYQAELDALAGNDIFQGSALGPFNDSVQTLGGNDAFIGLGDSAGSWGDVWFAGAGIDTSVYRGNMNEYTIGHIDNLWDSRVDDGSVVPAVTVRDSVPDRDGFDQLNEVERLQFNDFNLAFDIDGNAGQSYRLYQAAFDRTPDTNGLGYWIAELDGGKTVYDAASTFVVSDEFQSMYGPDSSNETFINALYMNVLDREADAGGYEYWLNEMAAGETRAEILVHFSESAENKANVFDQIANGITYDTWTPIDIVI